MARMKQVENGHRSPHWRDGKGNVYRYRTGDGVSGDPYIYQWHDPANCYQELQRQLLEIKSLRIETLVNYICGRFFLTLRSKDDHFRNSTRTVLEKSCPVRQVKVQFRTSYGHCPRSYASATAGDILNVYSTTGEQVVVPEMMFSTHQSITDFVEQVEAELVRQKMLVPAEKDA